MFTILNFVYMAFLIICLIISAIIAFHIIRYSFDKVAMVIMLIFFVSITSILLFANYILFSSLDLKKIFPNDKVDNLIKNKTKNARIWQNPF